MIPLNSKTISTNGSTVSTSSTSSVVCSSIVKSNHVTSTKLKSTTHAVETPISGTENSIPNVEVLSGPTINLQREIVPLKAKKASRKSKISASSTTPLLSCSRPNIIPTSADSISDPFAPCTDTNDFNDVMTDVIDELTNTEKQKTCGRSTLI